MASTPPASLRRRLFQSSSVARSCWSRWQSAADFLVRKLRAIGDSSQNSAAHAELVRKRFGPVPTKHGDSCQAEVDASFVTFNSVKWLPALLRSLEQQTHGPSLLHLSFVDHGSTDGTVSFLEQYAAEKEGLFASFSILQQPNAGYGAGHDRAIRATRSRWIVVSNVDVEWSPDLVSSLLSRAVNDEDGIASWEPRQSPYEHPKHYDPVTQETTWQSHACILMRRSAYTEVGGYDPELFMYGEDVEMSYRLRSHGYKLRYCPSSTFVHHHSPVIDHKGAALQLVGSAVGNTRNRLRYGTFGDKLIGVALLAGCLLYPGRKLSGARRHLYSAAARIAVRPGCGAARRGPHDSGFPFRLFSYEASRAGACYRSGPTRSGDLVSIITRTHEATGRDEYLRQAGLSVANQTHRPLEWIVVQDGGSSQGSVVQMIADSVPSLSVRFVAAPPAGRAAAGNAGLTMARGKFCMFLDDDDLLYADHVETLLAALAESGAAAAYSLAFEVRTQTEREALYVELGMRTPQLHRQPWDYDVLKDHNFIPIQSLLFDRGLFLERGGFDTSLDQLEDWNLWLRYGYGKRFDYVPKTTSLFRTPAARMERDRRQAALHAAYFKAREAAFESLRRLRLVA